MKEFPIEAQKEFNQKPIMHRQLFEARKLTLLVYISSKKGR
jgi:hypothetical protein